MAHASRRQLLTATAAAVSLPMVEAALGSLRSTHAATAPATGPARGAGARGNNRTAPDEPAGWFATTLKPADLKDGEFTDVAGHVVVLTRSGKQISALSTKCTHQGCKVPATAGQKILTCPCHQAQYNLDGSVAKGPARNALQHYALRVNDKGFIEVDPGQKLAKDAKEATVTIS
jgi:Rieske Fe-S protein